MPEEGLTLRNDLKECFQDISCFLLPYPGKIESLVARSFFEIICICILISISCLIFRQRCDQPSLYRVCGRAGFRVCDTCETLPDYCGGLVLEKSFSRVSMVFTTSQQNHIQIMFWPKTNIWYFNIPF